MQQRRRRTGRRPGRLSAVPPAPLERWLPWVLRITWIGVLWAGGAAVDGATGGRPDAIGAVATWGGGALWLAGVVTMAVPAVVTLTAMRAIVPLAVPAAVVAWSAGADGADGPLFLGIAAVSTLVAWTADTGRAFVQASAYGDEDRYLLRPPLAYALATGATWVVWAAAVLAGPLLLAGERYVLGGVVTALAIGASVWVWPRWHKLSRRWFVLVPVGIVVHDHVVLAETLMVRRQDLRTMRLAPAGTDAADMTGPASGHAVEVVTHDPVTATFAATPKEPRGRVIHLTACLVSPTRPGRLLATASQRRLPVG